MSNGQNWLKKFAVAISGLSWAVRNQNSFWVHLAVAAAVITVATWLKLEAWRWVAIVLAIAMVISIELLNTAIEQLIQVIHPEHDQRIGRSLDVAAGAVLLASIGAVTVGLIVLGPPLWDVITAQVSS